MSLNVTEFISQGVPSTGAARPNKFTVDITLPFSSPNGNSIRFFMEASSIPEVVMGVVRVPYMGRTVPLAGDPEYPDWNTTVQNDNSFAIHNIMSKWRSLINTSDSNVMDESVYPNGYYGIATVTQLGQDGGVLNAYQINGIFPTNVSPIVLNWSNNNAIETFDVTFAILDWQLAPTSQAAADAYSPTAPNDRTGQ